MEFCCCLLLFLPGDVSAGGDCIEQLVLQNSERDELFSTCSFLVFDIVEEEREVTDESTVLPLVEDDELEDPEK